ncbi:MAG: CapA family protein [Erysipelotrichaceae bacterium]|nr:CapA family protein [Erysipelotrichaceae bacterium]
MKKIILLLCIVLISGCKQEYVRPLKENMSKENKVSLMAVGDNLIHEQMLKEADQKAGKMNDLNYDFTAYYQHILTFLAKNDINYINQETILGGEDLKIAGYPSFNTPSIMAYTLNDVGFNVINSATNHCLDRGFEGIQHSRSLWRQFKDTINVGVNDSEEDEQSIRVIEKNGIRFTWLSYTYGTNGINLPNEYCVNLFDKERITKEVERAKKISDVVIVSAHWGDEYHFTTNSMQQDYANFLASLGVDVIIGGHPHVIEPIEWIKSNEHQTLVIYSLGNFVHGMLELETQLGGMVTMDFLKKEDQVTIENVKWHSLVNHFEGSAEDIMNTRANFTVYPLEDYSEELAKTHGLNGYNGIEVSRKWFEEKTHEVIDETFLE